MNDHPGGWLVKSHAGGKWETWDPNQLSLTLQPTPFPITRLLPKAVPMEIMVISKYDNPRKKGVFGEHSAHESLHLSGIGTATKTKVPTSAKTKRGWHGIPMRSLETQGPWIVLLYHPPCLAFILKIQVAAGAPVITSIFQAGKRRKEKEKKGPCCDLKETSETVFSKPYIYISVASPSLLGNVFFNWAPNFAVKYISGGVCHLAGVPMLLKI